MAKKILLFADGTGNAIATQGSKIWRIYQTLDPPRWVKSAITLPEFDTSEFKPLAVLDGAIGIGVPSDALKLYYFLSWNSSPGDEIYMCGFSRGSLTSCLRIALSCMLGPQPGRTRGVAATSAQMHRNAQAAWEDYKGNDDSRLKNIWVWLSRLGRKSQQAPKGTNVPITFVGVFDTVEAYACRLRSCARRSAHSSFPFPSATTWRYLRRWTMSAAPFRATTNERRSIHTLSPWHRRAPVLSNNRHRDNLGPDKTVIGWMSFQARSFQC